MIKPEVVIENWAVMGSYPDAYSAPERMGIRLMGEVANHPNQAKFKSGLVYTSLILSIAGNRVETLNTVYLLGLPDVTYVELCRERGWHIPTQEEPFLEN